MIKKEAIKRMVESIVYSIVPMIAMAIGIYAGYKLRGDGGKDKLPDIKSPKSIMKEHKQRTEEEKEIAEVKEWIEEIDNYNGEFGE